jgi:GntR family transcriptional repressor for pyruvate dehydrogenase complex
MTKLLKQKAASEPSGTQRRDRLRAAPTAVQVVTLGANKLLPEWIYEQLLEQIARGRLARGDRLPPEHALAQSFGVSRPTVRNALFRLQADGVVVSRKGSGNYVAETPSLHLVNLKPGSGNIAEMLLGFEFRVAIEGDAAALAATRRTDVELAALGEVIRRQKRSIGAPLTEVHDADIAFHVLIADAARNRLFVEAIQGLYSAVMNSWLLWHRMAANEYRQLWRVVLREHCAVYEAIRVGDAEAARTAMRHHLNKGRQRMLRTNEQQPASGK